MVLDRLAERWGVAWRDEAKFEAGVGQTERDGKRLILCRPRTYMNASGEAVGGLARFYRVPPERILIAMDEADLVFGAIRLRPGGSSGGHHGLDSVERHLGTQNYARLRIGIAEATDRPREITGFVLAPFGRDEMNLLERVIERACDQAECWLDHGIAAAMNRFNGTIKPN
jgi:PTH1 family peptidyl-tRNA hydrolase